MIFLIDGYNLLHALGLANRQMAKGELQRARLRMIDWLGEVHSAAAAEVHIIFDALHGSGPGVAEQSRGGVRISYAVGQLADDVIEELIAAEANPKQLTVVSNDSRLKEAARRRGCVAWSCAEYVDHLIAQSGERPALAVEEPPKPEEPTDAEIEEWLRRFGG